METEGLSYGNAISRSISGRLGHRAGDGENQIGSSHHMLFCNESSREIPLDIRSAGL